MPLNYPRSGYFLALYTLIQLVLNLGRADFSRNQKTHDLRTWDVKLQVATENKEYSKILNKVVVFALGQ